MKTGKRQIFAAFSVLVVCAAPGSAQEPGSAPLSAIEWLTQNAEPIVQAPDEPPIVKSGTAPEVTVAPLSDTLVQRIGLLPFRVTGLPPQMWSGAAANDLDFALSRAASQRVPAAQELLLTMLLAETDDLRPEEAGVRWLSARLDTLIQLGAVEPALALVMQADGSRNPALFARWLDLALLAKQEEAPCTALQSAPQLIPSEAARIYCTARVGDFDTAALLFGTASALDVLSPDKKALLARFLDPDLFEDDPLPRAPVRPDPLTFRLFEAAGAPLPTTPLPRAFAHTDLSSDAGWKAQLEAAERLARVGILPSNRLLGLYTDRKAAASGGIWDRVRALQAFEAALAQQEAEAIAKALPALWRGIRSAGLEVVFSDLYAAQLAELTLPGAAAQIAHHMELLSRSYETAPLPAAPSERARFLASVAQGTPDPALAQSDMARAVAAAFGDAASPSAATGDVTPDKVGLVLLDTLATLADAGRGDLNALQTGLSDLRALGLEDIARRAALQMLILKDRG